MTRSTAIRAVVHEKIFISGQEIFEKGLGERPVSVTLVHRNPERVDRLIDRFKEDKFDPLPDFVYSVDTPWFPPLGASWAVPFFFTTVPHLYGLWEENGERFVGPVRGYIDGRSYEGEDFLWKSSWRSVQEEPRFVSASFQSQMTQKEFTRLFRSDAGSCPLPLLKSHVELARAMGESLEKNKWTPHKILEDSHRAPDPLERFVSILSELPGYREDPFQRKTFLLALILSGRPEKFLRVAGAPWPPVLDRHALRLALRWGALEVRDEAVASALKQRRTVPPPVEDSLRLAAYELFRDILKRSGRAVPETFACLSAARDFCPDTVEPDCPRCVFEGVCEKKTDYYEPVVCTLNY